MRSDIYRYRLSRQVRWTVVDETVATAIAAVQALYGEARSRIEVGYAHDRSRRTVVVDATLPPGRAFARIFAGLLIDRVGPNAIRIEPAKPRRRVPARECR
jgi:hypothetical protein